jgi:hypothetical protein
MSFIIVNALVVVALWRIFVRTGLPPAWSLIGLLFPIIPWFILAFADWPAIGEDRSR